MGWVQGRTLILLSSDDDPDMNKMAEMLRSPLGLAQLLACLSFTTRPKHGLFLARDNLDPIKKVAAGLARAEAKSKQYRVADYAAYVFAFQQFFHSSYRARQGLVLERILGGALRDSGATVYETKREALDAIRDELHVVLGRRHDVDVMAKTSRGGYLIVQLRSTDNTGGTTAKGSLVDLLADILRSSTGVSRELLYLVVVWEKLNSAQKRSLVTRLLEPLGETFSRDEIQTKLTAGFPVQVGRRVRLQLVYGKENIADTLSEFTSRTGVRDALLKNLTLLESWDDLWMAYALASLELERLVMGEQSNFQLLEQKLELLGVEITPRDWRDYTRRSEELAERVYKTWTEESIPMKSPADMLTYIRDLILLKMIQVKAGAKGQAEVERVFLT